MFRQFLLNRIRKQENGYYCNLCENFLQTKEDALVHIASTNVYHNTLKRAQFNELEYELSIFSEGELKTVVDNYILQIRPSEYRCHICNCVIHHMDRVFGHIEKKGHLFKIKNQEKEAFGGQNTGTQISVQGLSKRTANVRVQNHEAKQIEQTLESLDCKLCNIKIGCERNLIEHQKGKRHLRNLDAMRLRRSAHKISNLPVYTCFLCDGTFYDRITIMQHFTEPGNGCSVSSLLKQKRRNPKILACELCLINISNTQSCLIEHTQGKCHKRSAIKKRKELQQKSTKCDVRVICNALEPSQNIYNSPPYICFFCKCTFSDKDAIARHFFEFRKSCLASSFIKKHFIVDDKVIFSCELCDTSLFKHFDSLLAHTQGIKHKSSIIRESQNSHLNIVSCAKSSYNADHEPNKKCDGNGRQSVQDFSSASAYICLFCESNFSDKNTIVHHFFQPVNGCSAHLFLKRTIVNNKTIFSCILCHVCLFDAFEFISHTQGNVHKITVEDQRKIGGFGISKKKAESDCKVNLKENVVFQKGISEILMNISNINVSYYCNICKITTGSDLQLFKHLNGLQHKNRISKLPKGSKSFIYCPACQVRISEDEAIMNHLDSNEHKKRLFILSANSENSKTNVSNQTSEIQNESNRKIRKPENEDRIQSIHFTKNEEIFKNKLLVNISNVNLHYKCYVCNMTLDSDLQLLDHLNDPKHKNSLSTLPRDFLPYIYCPLCKSDIFEDEEMISHLESDVHKTRFLDLSAKSDSKIGNVSQDQTDLQSNLVSGSKTILDELCSEMVRKPRRPNTELKNKNKFTPHFSEEYSRMFLEMGPSNIFNVDKRKMEILKSGIALSFLLNDERLCLACNQKIPNNLQALYEHLLNADHIRKLDQLVINDLEFEHFRDQFSDLSLAKEFLIEVNDNVAFCFPCKVEIDNDDSVIKNHVENDKNHRVKCHEQRELTQDIFKKFTEQLNNVWYIVQRFWCKLCNTKFEFDIDFVDHIKGKKHAGQVKKLKGMEICYDVCIPCASISMGLSDTYTKHCEDKMHKYLVKSKDYAVPETIKSARNLLNNVEETTELLVLESDAAKLSEEKICLIFKFLEEIVKSHYPEAKAYVFGSREANLAFFDSDVDIFLDCGNAYNGTQLLSKTREYLLNSQICFESKPDEWDLKEVLLKVRAPIIKVFHRQLGLNCDVSFTSGLTVEKTKIVKLFMISYPPCRKMVLYLKKWMNACLLADSQGLTTFGITWFVIFYFQQIKILPSIAELMKNKTQSKIIAGWETGIGENIPIKQCSLKFQELLRGFFKFYADYNYRSCVISPLMGKSLRKKDFTDNHIAQLPPEMESYSRCLTSTPKPEIFRIDSPLCLQDPIDLVQNITRSVSKLILRCFIQSCRTSAEILSNLR